MAGRAAQVAVGLALAVMLPCGATIRAAPGDAPSWRLVDPAGRPVAGATVTVVGRAGSVVTGPGGLFRLDPEPVPPFELAVFDRRGAWLGWITVQRLPEGTPRTLTLPPLERVEVALREGIAPSTAAPPAAAATVVSRTDTDETMPARFVQMAAGLPNARAVGSGPAAVPSIRGLASGRTLLLLDDARVSAERRVGPSAAFLDPFSLETVEVVRGPGSVAYGSDALGGVLHARTPRPRPGVLSSRFESAAGAGEGQARAGAEVNFPAGSGAFLFQAHGRSFQDYRSPAGTVPNSSARDGGFLARYAGPAGEAWLGVGLQSDRGRDIGKPKEGSSSRTRYPLENSDRLSMDLDLPPAGSFTAVEVHAFLGSYRLVTDRESPVEEDVVSVRRADVTASDASLRVVATRPIPRGVVRAGFDGHGRFRLHARDQEFTRDGEGNVLDVERDQRSIGDASSWDAGVFAEAERNWAEGRYSVGAGLRGDAIRTRNSGGLLGDASTSRGALSGYAALTLRPAPDWSLTLQAASGFRDPKLSDRYFSGVTGRGTITGNPDLRPETSTQYDAALRVARGRMHLAAFGYLYRIRDLVERFEVEPPSERFAFRNRGTAKLQGVEIEGRVDLRGGWSARLGLGTARGRNETGDPLDDVPPASAAFTVDGTLGRWWIRGRWTVTGRNNDPGPTETVRPGYAVLDLANGVRLRGGLEARLLLGNVLDREYHPSADAKAVAAPGRSAMLVLAGRFGMPERRGGSTR